MSKALRVRVENGRFVGEAPAGLPEGTELEVVLPDEGDDMSDAEVDGLNAAIDLSIAQQAEGKVVTPEELRARLTRK